MYSDVNQNDPFLDHVIEQLQNSTLYLANPSLLNHVKWIASDGGRRRVLVEKTPSVNSHTFPRAALEVIGVISSDNFGLLPCAVWNGDKGPRNDWAHPSSFEKANARAWVCAHQHPTVTGDWPNGLENLNRIIQSANPENASNLRIEKDTLFLKDQLRIRHAIFETKRRTASNTQSSDDTVNSEIEDWELDPAFSIANLRCRTLRAEKALKRVKNEGTYDFSPLPATDINENPIPPSVYEEKLSGATVLLRFVISCDVTSSKALQFYADIESLSVLQEPRIIHTSISEVPSKRPFEVPDIVKRSKARKE